jgi:hypothetical protein
MVIKMNYPLSHTVDTKTKKTKRGKTTESSCGKSDETAKHFLVHCKNHTVQRHAILIGIPSIDNDLSIDEHTLLFGNEMINDETKFVLVQKFIQHTGCTTIN